MKFLKGLGYVAAGLWVFLFSRSAALGITFALFPIDSASTSFLVPVSFILWLLIGPGVVVLFLLAWRKIKERQQRKAKAAEEQERLAAAARQQARAEGFAKGLAQGWEEGAAQALEEASALSFAKGLAQGQKEGIAQGIAKGLTQGREEGFSLGHSEGYKYALYTQGCFCYYSGTPPLTYEDARRSLDEGQEGTNGKLIQEAADEGAVPVKSLGQQSAPVEKREEPTTCRDYATSVLPPLRRTVGGLDFESHWTPIPRDDFSERPTEDTVIAYLEPEE